MNLYQAKIAPYYMKKNLGAVAIIKARKDLLKAVSGKILEVGIGAGANLPYYPSSVESIDAIDLIIHQFPESKPNVNVLYSKITLLPYEDNSFDTIIATFCLSCIDSNEIDNAMNEIKRVLKPHGRLLILDFIQNEKTAKALIQDVLNPVFGFFTGGCRNNHNYETLLSKHDFLVAEKYHKHATMSPNFIIADLFCAIIVNKK